MAEEPIDRRGRESEDGSGRPAPTTALALRNLDRVGRILAALGVKSGLPFLHIRQVGSPAPGSQPSAEHGEGRRERPLPGSFAELAELEPLARRIVADLVRNALPGRPLRIWALGPRCGRDAHWVAMTLLEELPVPSNGALPFRIFATDASPETVERARAGIYPEAMVAALPSWRRERFFRREEEKYRVIASLRDAVTCAIQNVLTDPPVCNVDLVLCRDLLAEAPPDRHGALPSVLHYASNPGAYLLLGEREAREASRRPELFAPVEAGARLYRRIDASRTETSSPRWALARASRAPEARRTAMRDRAQSALLDHLAAASVVVNEDCEIVHFFGDVRPYLRFPSGEPELNLLAMAPAEIREALRDLVLETRRLAIGETSSAMAWVARGANRADAQPVRISVRPIETDGETDRLVLVIFDTPAGRELDDRARLEEEKSSRLASDLQRAREELEAMAEKLATAERSARASREEALSIRQELAALETRSRRRIEELERADRESLLRETRASLAVLVEAAEGAAVFATDAEGAVTSWNPGAARLFGYAAEEIVGRPASHLWAPEESAGASWRRAVERCLASGHSKEETALSTRDGGRIEAILHVQARRNDKGELGGFLLAVTDQTERRRSEAAARRSEWEIRRMAEELDQRVRRVEELAAAEREADRAGRGRVAGELDHALQETLRAAVKRLGYLRRLVESEESYDQVNQLEIFLRRSLERIRALALQLGPPRAPEQTPTGASRDQLQ